MKKTIIAFLLLGALFMHVESAIANDNEVPQCPEKYQDGLTP